MNFEWFFDDIDLKKANQSTVEDEIVGWIYPATDDAKYVVDIHKEYFSSTDCGFDLEVYTEPEKGGHGEWLGSIHDIRSATSIKRFKSRAEKLLESFIKEQAA